jgi:multidrug resistance efflux pump
MKSRDAAQRLLRFEVEEKGRKVADLEYMIREFEQMAGDLDRQIHLEEDRTGVKDLSHFAYSTFAKAAAQRRDNLKASVQDLQAKLELATRDRDAAVADLERAMTPDPREQERSRSKSDRLASMQLR